MGDDTGLQVRIVVSRLLMNGFGCGILRGDQHNYKWSNMSQKVMGNDTGFTSKRHISVIYERIWSGFVAWWSMRPPLTNYNVEIGVSRNAGSSVICRKMDVGFRVHEPEDDQTWKCANYTIFFRFFLKN
jgi:hypothetical protein